jgi:hypothetical protein
MTTPEPAVLAALDAALRSPRAAAILNAAADEVAAELARTPNARLAWRPIPLETYDRLPGSIASSWVFVLRAGCTSGAERHPNSIQRFMSFRGAADMQIWGPRYAPGKPASGQTGWSRASALQSNAETEAASAAGVPLHRAWLSNHLISDPEAPLDRRWLSIPVNTWHRPVMGAGDWTVVSFHTAPDDQLIEERPADDENPDAGLLASSPYAGRHAR